LLGIKQISWLSGFQNRGHIVQPSPELRLGKFTQGKDHAAQLGWVISKGNRIDPDYDPLCAATESTCGLIPPNSGIMPAAIRVTQSARPAPPIKLHKGVAPNTRNGSLSSQIGLDEWENNRLFKGFLEIDDIKWNIQVIGDTSCVMDVVD
jgi:hypothetical protein